MPLYEYQCQRCGTTFEKLVRSFSDSEGIRCPECAGTDVKKAFSTFATRTTGGSAASVASCAPGGA